MNEGPRMSRGAWADNLLRQPIDRDPSAQSVAYPWARLPQGRYGHDSVMSSGRLQ